MSAAQVSRAGPREESPQLTRFAQQPMPPPSPLSPNSQWEGEGTLHSSVLSSLPTLPLFWAHSRLICSYCYDYMRVNSCSSARRALSFGSLTLRRAAETWLDGDGVCVRRRRGNQRARMERSSDRSAAGIALRVRRRRLSCTLASPYASFGSLSLGFR